MRREHEAQRERQRWKNLSAAEKELDWQRYGKYDALQQLLSSAASDPSFKVCISPSSPLSLALSLPGRSQCRGLRHAALLSPSTSAKELMKQV